MNMLTLIIICIYTLLVFIITDASLDHQVSQESSFTCKDDAHGYSNLRGGCCTPPESNLKPFPNIGWFCRAYWYFFDEITSRRVRGYRYVSARLVLHRAFEYVIKEADHIWMGLPLGNYIFSRTKIWELSTDKDAIQWMLTIFLSQDSILSHAERHLFYRADEFFNDDAGVELMTSVQKFFYSVHNQRWRSSNHSFFAAVNLFEKLLIPFQNVQFTPQLQDFIYDVNAILRFRRVS